MAGGTKVTKISKANGKDIRMFFSGSASSSQKTVTPTPRAEPTKKATIEISDNENKPKQQSSGSTRPGAKKNGSTKSNAMVVDDSEEERPTAKSKATSTPTSTLKRKKATALLSSEDDDDTGSPPPKKKPAVQSSKIGDKVKEFAAKRGKVPVIESDSESDIQETPSKKKPSKASTTPAKSKSKLRISSGKTSASKTKSKKKEEDDFIVDSDDEDEDFDGDEDEEDEPALRKKNKPSPVKKAPKARDEKPAAKGKVKTEGEKEDTSVGKSKPKHNSWAAAKAAKMATPVAAGSKAIPDAALDALSGLSFVFTGELTMFSRDEAVDLAKRFGGRVVGQPSSKTDYVVLGDNAGPKKIDAIKKHGIRTLNEDEFLNLIGSRKGPGKLDEKAKKKLAKEEEAIKKAAKEIEQREKKGDISKAELASQLWTTRYAPQTLKEVCGNKAQVEKLQQWLNDWDSSLKSGFKKPGKNGMNIYRAVLITGNPGIGKTTSAHLCAKLAGFTPIELNASDTRSKKLVENGMNVNNKSLDSYVSGGSATNSAGVAITDRTCLIMDEVDGMSAGDRGGVGALNAMIKKSRIPIICIANDRQAQKLKPLQSTTFGLPFSKPQVNHIRSRLLTIAFKENMKIPANVLDQLIDGSQSDIRQVLNMLSTWKLSNDAMSFDESKTLAKMNEKHTIMNPFDLTIKLLGPYVFSPTSRETLGDKMEMYFQDHSFMPLFMQENYLKTEPAKIRNVEGPEKAMKQLRLMDAAASSISDGDLVDALIHGPEQHWTLMPLHAVCSTVRPASQVYGAGAHYGGPNSINFPTWLGHNSRQQKLTRQLTDVQIRMRLKVSGNRFEIRQSYIPSLFPHIVTPLADIGASAVDEVIERMDEYYLCREDWDTIVELGVGENKDANVLKKISTATKTSLTRKYNSSEHPIPFHKATDLDKVPKKLAAGPAPDLEDAYEVDDAVDDIQSDDEQKTKSDDGDGDVRGDKLIKESKKKGAAKGGAKAKGKK